MNNVALHIKKQTNKQTHNSANHLYTQIQNKRTRKERKKDKRAADSVPLGPWGPGLASRLWGLSRLGPHAGLSWG